MNTAKLPRFRIHRARWGRDDYQWVVIGSRPDEDDDFMWGNFNTWSDALSFVATALRKGVR